MTQVTTGEKIRTMRALRGISQLELAQRVGIDRTFISYFENGRAMPSLDQLSAIQAALRVEFDHPDIEAAFVLLVGANGT